MKVIDPGHQYELNVLDPVYPDQYERLTFVKREGPGYPGNIGHHPGTNMQEVLRALIDRVNYLDAQVFSDLNAEASYHLRLAMWYFEKRAAIRHSRLDVFLRNYDPDLIETYPTCRKCEHVGCKGECHP